MIQVDFVIITILQEECDAVLERFPQKQKPQQGPSGQIYAISQIETQQTGQSCTVAIVKCPRPGNDIAQKVANDAISDLDPQMLLIVGIAGGVPSDDFTLGDVIVSNYIANLNVSKRTKDGQEEFDMQGGIHAGISTLTAGLSFYKTELAGWNDSSSIKVSRPTVKLSQFSINKFKDRIPKEADESVVDWYNKIQSSIVNQFRVPRAPKFRTSTIASSNTVIRNIDLLIQWLKNIRSIMAVEMESAGVYQATQGGNKQYKVMAIRGISDIIGLEPREDQWKIYACHSAAAFAHRFITAGIVAPRATTTVTGTPASVSSSPAQKSAQPSMTQRGKQADGTGPIEVFISYAEKDEKFKEDLETHLTLLRREGVILPWNSQKTKTGLGKGREQEIAEHINSAQIILLLMSPSFLKSDQLYENEMMRAIERQKAGDPVRVIPIAVRPIPLGDPDKTPYQKIQGLPRNGKPVESWRSVDEAWASIAQEIREVCKDLLGNAKH